MKPEMSSKVETAQRVENPCGVRGIAFLEFSAPTDAEAEALEALFVALGFSRVGQRELRVDGARGAATLYAQGAGRFVLQRPAVGHAAWAAAAHGPTVSAMGWRVEDPAAAFEAAVRRGARPFVPAADAAGPRGTSFDLPAVHGIGDSLIYFIGARVEPDALFEPHPNALLQPGFGFRVVDHLTNNVPRGTLDAWAKFYREVFGFVEVRHFDIRGERTGLYSFALRSPDGSFCIPINEGTEGKSQIEEYLREHRGPGIQHIALLTDDLIGSMDGLAGAGIPFLDIDAEYYERVFDRVPGVTEDHARIQAHQILVDGDEEGYLLQIFTGNLIGPAFFELIQRKNHHSFGEGNFGALFRSIERDQMRRGVL